MAQSPPPPQTLDPWALPQGWGWAAAHPDSTSPASSSSDSSGSCPCDGGGGAGVPSRPKPPARSPQAAPTATTTAAAAPGRARPAPAAGGQRQSASEREKLRMRTLARALHELRRFLPPSVAPAGQSLTKIETLRLAIRYIAHLSAVLGLSEDSLRRCRRSRPRSSRSSSSSSSSSGSSDAVAPRGCPLCPDGGSAQAQALTPTSTPTPARGLVLGSVAPAAGSWGSPPACLGVPEAPGCLGSRIPDVGPWVSPPYCSGAQSLPPVSQRRAPDAALWTPPEAGSGTQLPLEPGTPAAPEPAAVYQGICVAPEPCLWPETPPLLPGPACQRLQPQAQWGYWSHSADVLPSSEPQGPGPTFHFSDESPLQSSGLQLGGCPELWPEELEGSHLSIFY